MNVTGNFGVICAACDAKHTFTANETDFDARYSHERQMGEENGYVWQHNFECGNSNCKNEIEIEYQAWEYPVGAFNTEVINVRGGEYKDGLQFDFHYPED